MEPKPPGRWDPVEGQTKTGDIPSNFSPGVIPVLAQILTAAVHQRLSHSAVLSRETVHIKGAWDLDMGWGCGYRNALMAISALLIARPGYRRLFSRDTNGADPGVRRLQGWIEEAWGNGYDRTGRNQLKGKVLGTRKWIGASGKWSFAVEIQLTSLSPDLYAMFTSKAVP